jgi:hypothetical protein
MCTICYACDTCAYNSIQRNRYQRNYIFLKLSCVLAFANQNSIQEEINSRLKSENACYHSVQNLLSSSLLSKNIKTQTYRTIILHVVFHGCETWSLTLMDERRLRVLRISGPKRDEGGNREVKETA